VPSHFRAALLSYINFLREKPSTVLDYAVRIKQQVSHVITRGNFCKGENC
jgi:hypothetical protein